MPQTMPLDWLNLFIMFILTFAILNIKIYYCNQKMPTNMKMTNMKNINWKW